MSGKDIFELIIQFIEVLTDWPIIIFLLVISFRKQIKYIIQEVATRIRLVEFGENKLEFLEIEKETFSYTLERLAHALDNGAEDTSKLKHTVNLLLKKVKGQNLIEIQHSKNVLLSRQILWVDDKPNNNIYESSVFQALGATVEEAYTTDEAISKLEQREINIIISDIHRIETGIENHNAGYDLLDRVRKSQKNYIPLIFYTGNIAWIQKDRARFAHGSTDSPADLIIKVIDTLK